MVDLNEKGRLIKETILKAVSKEAIIIWGLGAFLVVTFILQFVNPYPGIPEWPYDKLYEGGIGATGITILYHITYKIPGHIRELGEKIEKNLLGSLKDTYTDFKEELRDRLTETE